MKRANQRKFHYIYKITNKLNGKFYIGMHSTDNLGDGYFGSGKLIRRSVARYGKENHRFEILEFLESRRELCYKEEELLTEELLSNPLCLNLSKGGAGGNKIVWTPERRAERGAMFAAMERTHEHKARISNALKGKNRSDAARQNISKGLTGHTQKTETINKRVAKLAGRSKFIWILKTPENEEIKIPSLTEFCRQMGFNYRSMFNSLSKPHAISSGPAKGWKVVRKDQI